ncbi:uncharacterized protein LOC142328925 isoform X2 [Lycorma delicatula]|uniref:uncharacterized protein LOC142328925 isoform X2 n=1 Tax=Lycorma delicatula TaxID=130591 RepID=UPI003F512295
MGRRVVLSVLQPVGFIAALSSGVQGLIWALCYLAALLTHYCVLQAGDTTPLTFSDYLAAYLQGHRCTNTIFFCESLVGPEQIAIWLVLAVIFNFLLLAASITLILVLTKCMKERYFVFINTWIGLSITSFLIDIGLSLIFAIDLVKLENKELDLSSNWPSTTDSSYDFGQGEKEEVFGIVNPIQDRVYPDYSAKGRWPSLNQRRFNTGPIHHAQESIIEDDLPPRLVNEDYNISNYDYNNSNNICGRSNVLIHNNNNNSYSNYIDRSASEKSTPFNTNPYNDEVFHINMSQDLRNRTPHNLQFNDKSQDIYRDSSLYSRNNNNNNNIITDHNKYNNYSNRNSSKHNSQYESKTVPSRLKSIPVPPPLPPINADDKNNKDLTRSNYNNNIIQNSLKINQVQQNEPDYSPPTTKRQYRTYNSNKTGSNDDQATRLRMSLHEAIKSRPPLRPVLQRMNVGTTEC